MSNHTETLQLPGQVADALRKFLSECRTGNITLNIQAEQILGAHINEIISVKPATRLVAINGAQRRSACPNQT